MRQTDLGDLQTAIENQLDSQEWYLQSYIDDERIINVVAAIYLNNDMAIEVTTRIKPLTIIATTHRISVIIDADQGTQKRSTYYKATWAICQYQDMNADVFYILNIIDFCLLRLQPF